MPLTIIAAPHDPYVTIDLDQSIEEHTTSD
jgi:hypothetical protein